MCGRYAAFLPAEAVARLFHTVNATPNVAPSWNVAPTQDAMVVRRHPKTGERHLDLLKWGLLPSWTKDPAQAGRPINARSESFATFGLFRDPDRSRRAIVPADLLYEWKAGAAAKQPFAIARADGQPLAFAAVWEGVWWPDGEITRTFAILTTAANTDIAALHERSPVILEQADWPVWLGEADPSTLLHSPPEGTLRFWPVGAAVSAARNNGPEMIEPPAA
jgi:putative SOS response-associated peptidase YedK